MEIALSPTQFVSVSLPRETCSAILIQDKWKLCPFLICVAHCYQQGRRSTSLCFLILDEATHINTGALVLCFSAHLIQLLAARLLCSIKARKQLYFLS